MEMEVGCVIVVILAGVGTMMLVLHLYSSLWWRPEKLRRALGRQGITGPRPSFLLGNIREMKTSSSKPAALPAGADVAHDYSSTFFPYFNRWRNIYGPVYMFTIVNNVSLYISDPSLVKEMCLNKSLAIGKTSFSNRSFHALFGKGIIQASGHAWAVQRKIIAPEFFMDKVKGLMNLIERSSRKLLESWEDRLEQGGGIADMNVDKDFQSFSADVLSRACFGSDYSKGEEIFSKITTLQVSLPMQSFISRLPGSNYLPTKTNRTIWRLVSDIRSSILKVVEQRNKEENESKDLLQSIIKNAAEAGADESFVVDNCKNIYFAGQETISTAAKWALVLLATNQEWQTRARREVMEVCGARMPSSEELTKMTLLTQVIQETLRLYPAAPFLARQVHEDMKLGHLHLPKGTAFWIPLLSFHHDPELWGPDAHRFNPDRFARGVSGACKHPHMYMPFGTGPRTCLGQNLAMVELKIVLASILARYRVSPSPNYCHSVNLGVVMGPKYGVNLVIERV
ncbi:cytochrome P450 714C2-like [Iris pallida]|uniref:Cytochrome P450 714C2-like n=1 Tax=Iris pallida TaxID=29817 RepID=A0AAX6GSW9_IRIPA|nr:cytochrome P450 714C2-like [Iris pallida]